MMAEGMYLGYIVCVQAAPLQEVLSGTCLLQYTMIARGDIR
jgi:hypothetical protein